MSHRLWITLNGDQYRSLKAESVRTGVSMAELVRQAIVVRFGIQSDEQRAASFRRVLSGVAGIWRNRSENGIAYQRRIRAASVAKPLDF